MTIISACCRRCIFSCLIRSASVLYVFFFTSIKGKIAIPSAGRKETWIMPKSAILRRFERGKPVGRWVFQILLIAIPDEAY